MVRGRLSGRAAAIRTNNVGVLSVELSVPMPALQPPLPYATAGSVMVGGCTALSL